MEEETKPGLYEAIRLGLLRGECMLCTALEGTWKGEKALFCGETRIWPEGSSRFGTFLKEHLSEMTGSGIWQEGEHRIFYERFGRESELVVCGGGHVAAAVVELGKKTGFWVTVLEDRPSFADNGRRAGADEVLCDSFENGMARIAGGAETYFVIVTRGHRYDLACLEQALKKEHAYVGMMGSRKRTALVREQLAEKGIDRELLEQVHAPIGLSIGAETPEEIAVSILAEIIQVKNSRKRTAGYAGEILDALLEGAQTGEEPVLAVIIGRKGSAPRKVGTKMLIYPDGRTVGTIGGGCMESEVVRRARMIFAGLEPTSQCVILDVTGRDAQEEGMACGGVMEIYLERSAG
ncbi:MAG: XdhC family protein [Eubacteriales bacterium]|nr:XdhC family protein [Eubacteriales bacterium]